MIKAKLPDNEAERLEALHQYQVLDSESEEPFDDFTALASHICGTPISLVSLVDESRQWFKSKVGIDTPELPRDIAFCAHTILGNEIMEVHDAVSDERFRENPLVTTAPNIRFYAGAPLITPDGFKLGSLCVIDREPRKLTAEQHDALARLGRQVVHQLELRRQKYELRAAYSQLQQLEATRDSLVQMIVHDLRSLVGSVMGFLELASMNDLPQEVATDIASAMGCTTKLVEMISTVLDVGRLESGELPVQRSEVNVYDLVQNVAKRFEPLRKSRQVTITWQEGCPQMVACDPQILSRVVQNLLGNAFKYTHPDRGEIYIEGVSTENGLRVAVADNGPGIPGEHQEKVFEKFFQVECNYSTGHSTGLGLTFCKLAVEAHGGKIGVESRENGGSKFYFTLPLNTTPPN